MARERGGVLLPAELPPAVVRRRIASGDLVRAGRRSLVAATTPESWDQRLWVARADAGDPMWFTGTAALRTYRLPHAPPPPDVLQALVPNDRNPRPVSGVKLIRSGAPDLYGARIHAGHPVVALEVALRHTARLVSAEKTITLLQDGLRLRHTTHRRLLSACGRGRAGSARLRAALDVAGDGAHSRQERRIGAAMARRGMRHFRRGASVMTRAGASYWIDFLWERLRAGLEVNGDLHLDPVQAAYDARRCRRILTELDIVLLPLTAAEVDADVNAAVDEVVAFLTSRAATLGLPLEL